MANQDSIKLCECGCGQPTKIMDRSHTKLGHVKGRPLRFINGHNKRTHRMSYSKTYKIWSDMLDRCRNPDNHAFSSYGGRGISVCESWQRFEIFLSDMGEKPDSLSIDRKDNNKDYCPENCRWATMKEQQNNRRNTTIVTHAGVTKSLSLWADHYGMTLKTLRSRYFRGDRPPELFRQVDLRFSR